MTKERLLLCPEFSYVGGAVAPIAEKTLGMTSTGLLYNSQAHILIMAPVFCGISG